MVNRTTVIVRWGSGVAVDDCWVQRQVIHWGEVTSARKKLWQRALQVGAATRGTRRSLRYPGASPPWLNARAFFVPKRESRAKCNMRNKRMNLPEKMVLLRKRATAETINEQPKDIAQNQRTLHRSRTN
jgi:hypothetical protein